MGSEWARELGVTQRCGRWWVHAEEMSNGVPRSVATVHGEAAEAHQIGARWAREESPKPRLTLQPPGPDTKP